MTNEPSTTNNQAFEVKKAIDSAFTDDEEDLIPLSLLSKRLLTSRSNKRTSTSEDESSPKKKCEGSVTVNHAEISKEFNRLKELLEPSFPLMPSIRPLVAPDMDTDTETTLTANESATEVENFNESTTKPTKVTPTARKSFAAPRSPPTPLAFEPQTPPISEPDTEPQQERPTVPPTLDIFNFNLSDDVPTVSRDLPNFPFNIRQNDRFFETLQQIGLAIDNLKDFSLSPSSDDDLFATFLPQLTTRLEPLMTTLTGQKFGIFTNLKQLSIYLIDHFIFDILNICKYLLTDQLTKYENNAARLKHLRSTININYINNPNNPDLIAEYKRRRATQIQNSSSIREMMHTVNNVASLKRSIIYEDPLFDCHDAIRVTLLCAIDEIMSKTAMTDAEKIKDIFINTVM
ncbi:uncharacterized protein LOC135684097 [Rhopilema esculentum]|uniref:uncharacterized protein LOC135684097 n=1 Tax=Rhopilema esculentum TaxID=499914 RepID=UPI0031DA6309